MTSEITFSQILFMEPTFLPLKTVHPIVGKIRVKYVPKRPESASLLIKILSQVFSFQPTW